MVTAKFRENVYIYIFFRVAAAATRAKQERKKHPGATLLKRNKHCEQIKGGRKDDSQLQSRISRHVPKDSFLIYNCVPRKLKRHFGEECLFNLRGTQL